MLAYKKVDLKTDSFSASLMDICEGNETVATKKAFCFRPEDVVDYIANEDASCESYRATVSKSLPEIKPLIFIAPDTISQEPFISQQKWEGIVTEIDENNQRFFANLVDLYYGYYEVAEISMDEVLSEDVELVKPGAIFYWNIGYRQKHKTLFNESIILFRRLQKLTSEEIVAADKRADALRSKLGWDELE